MLYPEFWLLELSKSKIYEPGETVKLHEIINLLLRSREQVCTWRIFFVGQLKNIRHVRSYNIFKKVITRTPILAQLQIWERERGCSNYFISSSALYVEKVEKKYLKIFCRTLPSNCVNINRFSCSYAQVFTNYLVR